MTVGLGAISRRAFLIAAAATCAVAAPAGAQVRSLDSLTIIVPSSPGGGFDQTARAAQEALQSNGLIRAVRVENVPGGGGLTGIAQVIQMKGNAGTILQGGLANIASAISSQTPIDLNQLTPLARLTSEWQVIAVPAASEFKTMADLVKKMKENPAGIAWAGGPAGSHDHASVGLLAKAIGTSPQKVNYVPFSGGGQVSVALLGNQVHAAVSGGSEFAEHAKAGKLRILAVMSPERLPGIDAPTVKESGVDFEFGNWRAIFAPPGITADQRAALIGAYEAMVKTESWKKTLESKGWTDAFISGDKFATFFASEQARFAEAMASIGVTK
jgi:putative tricarboxylic transport membrane protein